MNLYRSPHRSNLILANQVESVGEGVTSVKVGDHVIPLYTAGAYTRKLP